MARRNSAFAIIRRGDRVLLVKSEGRWKLPGGRLKPRENPWEAAVREVDEETGLHASIQGLSGVYRRKDLTLAFVFLARVPEYERIKGARFEIEKQRWLPPSRAARKLGRRARSRLLDALRRPTGKLKYMAVG
jgi:8-oxo-dGTP diphosphatase